MFVDDITLPDGTRTSFETGLDGWAIPGRPGQRAERQRLDPHRRRPASRRAPSIATQDTLYMGFGFEGISTPRPERVMGRVIDLPVAMTR